MSIYINHKTCNLHGFSTFWSLKLCAFCIYIYVCMCGTQTSACNLKPKSLCVCVYAYLTTLESLQMMCSWNISLLSTLSISLRGTYNTSEPRSMLMKRVHGKHHLVTAGTIRGSGCLIRRACFCADQTLFWVLALISSHQLKTLLHWTTNSLLFWLFVWSEWTDELWAGISCDQSSPFFSLNGTSQIQSTQLCAEITLNPDNTVEFITRIWR